MRPSNSLSLYVPVTVQIRYSPALTLNRHNLRSPLTGRYIRSRPLCAVRIDPMPDNSRAIAISIACAIAPFVALLAFAS